MRATCRTTARSPSPTQSTRPQFSSVNSVRRRRLDLHAGDGCDDPDAAPARPPTRSGSDLSAHRHQRDGRGRSRAGHGDQHRQRLGRRRRRGLQQLRDRRRRRRRPADLSITKSEDINIVPARGEVTYTLEVENRGPSTAPGVAVTDTLAPNFTAIEATPCRAPAPTRWSARSGRWRPGSRATITIFARVEATRPTDGGQHRRGRRHGQRRRPVPGQQRRHGRHRRPGQQRPAGRRRASPPPAAPRRPVTFTIPVTNAGPSAAARTSSSRMCCRPRTTR